MTLQRILLALFGAALLIIVLITAGAAFNAREEQRNYELSRESYQRLLLLEDLITTLFEAESSQRGFLITGDELFLQEHQTQRQRLQNYQQSLDQTEFPDGMDMNQVAELRSLIAARLQVMDGVVEIFRTQGEEAAADSVSSYEGKRLMDAIRDIASRITAAERNMLNERAESAGSHSNQLTVFLLLGAVTNFLLLGGAYLVTRRSAAHSRRLLGRLKQSSDEISAINQLSSSLQSCNTLTESASILEHFSRQLFPNTTGGVYLMRSSRNLLQLAASWNNTDHSLSDPIEPHDCWALRLGKTYEIHDDSKQLRCRHLGETAHSQLCIPLMAQSDIVGLLSIEVESAEEFDAIRARAELMGTHTSAALASVTLREALRQQSIRDPLTGLYNRRYLEESMERELLRARRTQGAMSVLMIDIDHFKQFNDTHGHQAGDVLLKEFAEYLRRQVRAEDIPCRYGGEEFLIAMPGTGKSEALERAESLRQNMATLKVYFQGKTLPAVNASFGVSSFPDHGEDREALIRAADAALYKAKRAGRNRVMPAGEVPEEITDVSATEKH